MTAGEYYVVTADATYKRLIAPSGTAANLILCDGTTLNAQITISKGCFLNIYCQSGGTGTINAKAIESYYYAAIGTIGYSAGNSDFPCMGTLTIHGGIINANSSNVGLVAGIGGGKYGTGGTVTIYGGTITATGGSGAAGIGGGDQGNGGTVTIYGGHVFADGTDKGCGIGAGEDADGADVEIYGGIVEAWCGSGSRTAAIGSEEGDDHRGTLYIADNMMVHAGSSPTNVSKFPYDTRKPACWYRDYARIEPCDHEGKTYTVSGYGATDTHTLQCSYCLYRIPETHSFGEAGSPCSVCGVESSISTISIYLPEKVSGEFVNGHYGSTPSTVNLITNSWYTFPAPPTDHLPNGVTFAGWAVGTPTSLDIKSYWVDNNETIIKPGERYKVTENTSVTARYKAIELSLADNADNWLILYENNGKLAESVTLTGRTLKKDEQWNTLCLPFAVVLEGSPLAGADVRTLNNASFANGTLTLNFTAQNAITTIEAGKPYIIKWPNGSNLTETNLVFNNKTISYTMQDVVCDLGNGKSITFKGTYSYTNFIVETPSILLLGGNNTLFFPRPDETTNPVTYPTIGAQRAYFVLSGLTAGGLDDPQDGGGYIRAFILNLGDSEDTGITTTDYTNSVDTVYDLQGRRVNSSRFSLHASQAKPGVYIVNGRKVVIK